MSLRHWKVAVVIVDESAWQDGLEGEQGQRTKSLRLGCAGLGGHEGGADAGAAPEGPQTSAERLAGPDAAARRNPNIDLVRPFWPNVEMVADVAAEAPHQHVWQVVDRSYSKRHLELHDALTDDERRIRTRHLRNLNATLAAIGRSYAPGQTLVVAQKAIKEALPAVGMLPPSIELAHHNAVAGRDGWKDVAALVVGGRTCPLACQRGAHRGSPNGQRRTSGCQGGIQRSPPAGR